MANLRTTKEQREGWIALGEKATHGEWRKFAHEIRASGATDTYSGAVYGTIVFCESTQQMDDEGRTWTTGGNSHDNAAFIAASREALPALISDVETLAAEVERLRGALKPFAAAALKIEPGAQFSVCGATDDDFRAACAFVEKIGRVE